MKKLLIVLMVVAMASFLFVGCLGTTPPIDPDEPIEPVEPPTVAPIITSVPDIVGGYINKDNAADGIVVNGTAPTYSEVKVYINGLTAGTGDTLANGVFQVVVAKADLIKAVKTDGAKVLYATATEAGLEESVASNVATFILDTDLPGIKEVKATADTPAFIGSAVLTPITVPASVTAIAIPTSFTKLVDGTWIIEMIAASATVGNASITHDGITTFYDNWTANLVIAEDVIIPGVRITLGAWVIGRASKIVCKVKTARIPGRATLKFDEDVSSGAANAGTYAGTDVAAPPFVFKESTDTAYWTGLATLVVNNTMVITVSDVVDLAGNPIAPLSSASCIVGPASLTLLAP